MIEKLINEDNLDEIESVNIKKKLLSGKTKNLDNNFKNTKKPILKKTPTLNPNRFSNN